MRWRRRSSLGRIFSLIMDRHHIHTPSLPTHHFFCHSTTAEATIYCNHLQQKHTYQITHPTISIIPRHHIYPPIKYSNITLMIMNCIIKKRGNGGLGVFEGTGGWRGNAMLRNIAIHMAYGVAGGVTTRSTYYYFTVYERLGDTKHGGHTLLRKFGLEFYYLHSGREEGHTP